MNAKWLELAADILQHGHGADWRDFTEAWTDADRTHLAREVESWASGESVHDHNPDPLTELAAAFLAIKLRQHAGDVRLAPTIPADADMIFLREMLAMSYRAFDLLFAIRGRPHDHRRIGVGQAPFSDSGR
jgi:hypothetical protein